MNNRNIRRRIVIASIIVITIGVLLLMGIHGLAFLKHRQLKKEIPEIKTVRGIIACYNKHFDVGKEFKQSIRLRAIQILDNLPPPMDSQQARIMREGVRRLDGLVGTDYLKKKVDLIGVQGLLGQLGRIEHFGGNPMLVHLKKSVLSFSYFSEGSCDECEIVMSTLLSELSRLESRQVGIGENISEMDLWALHQALDMITEKNVRTWFRKYDLEVESHLKQEFVSVDDLILFAASITAPYLMIVGDVKVQPILHELILTESRMCYDYGALSQLIILGKRLQNDYWSILSDEQFTGAKTAITKYIAELQKIS